LFKVLYIFIGPQLKKKDRDGENARSLVL